MGSLVARRVAESDRTNFLVCTHRRSIFLVAPRGGIRAAQRRRSRLALTLTEREVISRGVTAHQSARSIARLLGRSPSTAGLEAKLAEMRTAVSTGYAADGSTALTRSEGKPAVLVEFSSVTQQAAIGIRHVLPRWDTTRCRRSMGSKIFVSLTVPLCRASQPTTRWRYALSLASAPQKCSRPDIACDPHTS